MEGILENETANALRGLMGEECALAAAVNVENASERVYDCLMLMEHRGEKSSGIVSVMDGELEWKREMGRTRRVFHDYDFEKKLPGKAAIGHNRYATAGAHDSKSNIQPFVFKDSRFGPFAIAHNGQLTDLNNMKEKLKESGALFQSTTDSELMGHLITHSQENPIEDAIRDACYAVTAAYSLLVMTPDKLIGLRDRFGVRPLSIGKMDGGHLMCSEDYVFDQYKDCHHIRDVEPSEMIIFKRGNKDFKSIKYAPGKEFFCVFESIYFSHPRTTYNRFYNEDFRRELGRQIFREHPDLRLKGDVVIPILDSGKYAARGLADISGLQCEEHFLRVHNPPRANRRSFTSSTDEEREKTAYQKLHLREDKVKRKNVITVDDSIVRSTTMKIINKRLREAGVENIINCISAPPIKNICPYGMDFQTRKELAAYDNSIEEIKNNIGADELIYLSLHGLDEVVRNTYNRGICRGCFGGEYPLPLNG